MKLTLTNYEKQNKTSSVLYKNKIQKFKKNMDLNESLQRVVIYKTYLKQLLLGNSCWVERHLNVVNLVSTLPKNFLGSP